MQGETTRTVYRHICTLCIYIYMNTYTHICVLYTHVNLHIGNATLWGWAPVSSGRTLGKALQPRRWVQAVCQEKEKKDL